MTKDIIVLNNPNCSSSRSIKILRENIDKILNNKGSKSILITSSIPKEGKTFISSNLAVSFAKKNYKVLIIDANLLNGNLNKIFNVDNDKGFSELLEDNIKNCENYIKKTKIENVSIITKGTTTYNECLPLNKLKDLTNLLSNKYDLILFDSASIKKSTHSLDLADIVEKILVICSINKTTKTILETTKNILKNSEDKIIYAINRVDNYL